MSFRRFEGIALPTLLVAAVVFAVATAILYFW
jgi:hypothetical protein